MSKTSTARAERKTGPDLRALLDRAGLKPVDLASRARIGTATVYDALKGRVLSGLQMWAISTALGLPEAEVRAAILRAKGAA